MAWRLRWFRDFSDADAVGMPPGAIWREHGHVFVVTPAGLADITPWEITGPDDRLCVSPSILNRGGVSGLTYHGYIRDGVLTDDVDGRSFPQHPATA